MESWQSRSDREPIFWIGQHAIRVTELLVIVHSCAFIAVAILAGTGTAAVLDSLVFHSHQVLGLGRVWQLITYIFIPSIRPGFILDMLMLFWFGRELESHFGRKGFILLYLCLAICPVLLISALYPLLPSAIFSGANTLHFALFLAFAALFPEAPMLFGISAKVSAIVLFSVYSLYDLAYQKWIILLLLWLSAGMAMIAVRAPVFANVVSWLETRREREASARVAKQRSLKEEKRKEVERNTDEILDKISRQGMQSLTASEKATLEKVRLNLLKKDQH